MTPSPPPGVFDGGDNPSATGSAQGTSGVISSRWRPGLTSEVDAQPIQSRHSCDLGLPITFRYTLTLP